MIRCDAESARGVIRECIKQGGDDNSVTDHVQQRLVLRVLELFRPGFDERIKIGCSC